MGDGQAFGVLVRAHRRRVGLTQEELADRAGLAARTIRNIEASRSHNPRQTTVRRLADVFGLYDVERDRFNELAVPVPGPPPAAVTAPAVDRPESAAVDVINQQRRELDALRSERLKLTIENDRLRRVAAHLVRYRPEAGAVCPSPWLTRGAGQREAVVASERLTHHG
jgi:transcriptional regulator with XRE-family HTH domain